MKVVDRNVEIALRWYCGACGLRSVIWHSPRMMCDAKEIAIKTQHEALEFDCPGLDYRVLSDSETRKLEVPNDSPNAPALPGAHADDSGVELPQPDYAYEG